MVVKNQIHQQHCVCMSLIEKRNETVRHEIFCRPPAVLDQMYTSMEIGRDKGCMGPKKKKVEVVASPKTIALKQHVWYQIEVTTLVNNMLEYVFI